MRTGTLADLIGNNNVSNEGINTNFPDFFTTLLQSHDNTDVANDDFMLQLLSEASPSQVNDNNNNNNNNVAEGDVVPMIPDGQQQQHDAHFENVDDGIEIVFDQGTSQQQQQQQQQQLVDNWNNNNNTTTLQEHHHQFIVDDGNNNNNNMPTLQAYHQALEQQQQFVVDEHHRVLEYLTSLDEFPVFSCANTCKLLREIVLVKGGTTCKFQIHGAIGLIGHAVHRQCHRMNTGIYVNGNESKIEMGNLHFDAIKAQIKGFLEGQKANGFVLLEDALTSFYETLSIGYNWVGQSVHNNPYTFQAGTEGTSEEGAHRRGRGLAIDKALAKEISSLRNLIIALETDILTALNEGQRKLYASGIARYQKQIADIVDGNLEVINRIMSKKKRKVA